MNTSTAQPIVGWYTAPNGRDTLSLVYSCLLTTFACTWTVLHLNVPGVNDSGRARFLRKAKWMVVTVLLPEFIFAKAVCELRLALETMALIDKRIQKDYSNNFSCKGMFKNATARWAWRVKYGRVVLILFSLFGLRRPNRATRRQHATIEEENMDRDEVFDHGNAEGRSIEEFSNIVQATLDNPGKDPASIDVHPFVLTDVAGMCKLSHVSSNLSPADAEDDVVYPIWHQWQDWTLTHSYFANMGGLLLERSLDHFHRDARSHVALTGHKLTRLPWCPHGHPLKRLALTQEDIADKSKADWVLKALSIMQISWIVLTVLARWASALPLTQLELATFAFSIFAVATYAINWWKPKDVSRPIYLSGYYAPSNPGKDTTQSLLWRLLSPIKARTHSPPWSRERSRVQNDMVEVKGRVPLIFRLMSAAAFVFGGTHCLAWSFAFPSHAEAVLWRVASIGSAIVPIIQLGINIFFDYLGTVAENSILPFLLKELDRSKEYPSRFFSDLKRAVFQTPSGDIGVSCVRIAGSYQFINERNLEEIVRTHQIQYKAGCCAEEVMCFVRNLSALLLAWKSVQEGNTARYQVRRFSCRLTKLERSYTEGLEAFFIDHEAFYDRTDIITVSSAYEKLPSLTVFGYLIDHVRPAFKDKEKRVEKIRKTYETISRLSTIICGIFYVSVRLIIIVLLFTSLREVPIEVYQETPWTRFLPKIS